jgi:hypothetical protein
MLAEKLLFRGENMLRNVGEGLFDLRQHLR